ncbi:hypothetical protein ACFCZ3_19935 [Cellulosimicrobium cellulans]|uniref:hypothetical protein n=1 Tax=Cellulosimicrobium cellulans TaxID=1710 RepID=UPI0035DD3440
MTKTETPTTARAITEDLMTRLRRHYIRPGQEPAGGMFLPEVGWNGTVNRNRCDALYVGFTSTSGQMLVGHEVKASRADWLTELSKPGKADAWAFQCHEWWLVTVPGVVQDGELPDGWGLMVPGRSKTRMQIVTPARRHPGRTPSWDATRSIMARQDTLRAQAVRDGLWQAQQKAREAAEAEVDRRVESRMRGLPDLDALQKELDLIRGALGVGRVIEHEGAENEARRLWRVPQCTDLELADVAALLRAHGDLHDATRALVGRASGLSYLRRALDEADKAREDLAAALQPQPALEGAPA